MNTRLPHFVDSSGSTYLEPPRNGHHAPVPDRPSNRATVETLTILLIAEREETRGCVQDALERYDGDLRLTWVSQPDLSVARAKDIAPDVVLVDDQLGTGAAARLIRELAVQVSGAAILALLDESDMGEARQAVLAGARGFVTKPLVVDDFLTTIQQVLSQRSIGIQHPAEIAQAEGQVIVFCAPKGGTGRTTMAVNLAISLRHQTDRPVVLVDADFAAPALDVAMNLRDGRDIGDLLSRLSRLDEELIDRVLTPHASGVRVLLAPPPAAQMGQLSQTQIRAVLGYLKRMFGWVVVDLGLPLDETAFAFLDNADLILLSVLPEMVGLRNTRWLLDQLRSRGYPDDKTWLVLNRATLRGGVRKPDIERHLHVRVRHSVPDDQPLASFSVNRGVPLMMSHERSAVARAIRQLAGQVAVRLGVQSPGPAPSSAARAFSGPLTRWLQRLHKVRT